MDFNTYPGGVLGEWGKIENIAISSFNYVEVEVGVEAELGNYWFPFTPDELLVIFSIETRLSFSSILTITINDNHNDNNHNDNNMQRFHPSNNTVCSYKIIPPVVIL